MSDERLRTLERQWQESGTVGDEAAYLIEAVRSGALPAAKLELASDLGHRAARIALSNDPLKASDLAQLGWLLRQRWGQWQLVRASWAVTRRVIPAETVPLSAIAIEVRDALAAVEAWLASPQSTRAVRLVARRIVRDDLVSWASAAIADAVLETLWAVTRPPMQGSPSTRGCQALEHAGSVLGLDALLDTLATDVIPKILVADA